MRNVVLFIILIFIYSSCESESQGTTYIKGSITTTNITEITETTAVCGGKLSIDSQGGTADVRIPQKGIFWSSCKENMQSYDNFNKNEESGMSTNPFQDNENGYLCRMASLLPNTKYYVRAFAQIGISEKKYVYGDVKEFCTTKTGAIVQTLAVSNITTMEATLSGYITNAGIPTYSERGFCYSESSEVPTINNNKIVAQNPVAVFTGQYDANIDITKFTEKTYYNVRAYIINAGDASYGEVITLKSEKPSVSVKTASDITATSAKLEAVLINKGIPLCSEWGFYYSETADFPANNTVKQIISTMENNGAYICNLSDIKPNTRYYYYAYAINPIGATHGEVMSFQTPMFSPVVATLSANNITATSATIFAQTTNTGTPNYTERGICCSRNINPAIDNNEYKIVIDGNDEDIFIANFTNLTDGDIYNARAYVIWNGKPIYGENIKFAPYSYKIINNLAIHRTDMGAEPWSDAAKLCENSILGGKKWRLPTISELQILFNHRDEIGNFETSKLGQTYYWSSTLQSSSYHSYLDFSDGSINKWGNKFNDNTMYNNVRCVCEK